MFPWDDATFFHRLREFGGQLSSLTPRIYLFILWDVGTVVVLGDAVLLTFLHICTTLGYVRVVLSIFHDSDIKGAKKIVNYVHSGMWNYTARRLL